MSSHIIISQNDLAFQCAESLSPFPLKPSPDCLILDKEGSLKIEDSRLIKQFITKKPYEKEGFVIYLPEAERLTIPAQNALLKTLEEPPTHATIILSTNHLDRLLPTIISRCQLHEIKVTPGDKSSAGFRAMQIQIKIASIGQKMTLAQSYSYPKDKPQRLCQEAIHFYRQNIHQNPTKIDVKNLKLAQRALQQLENNVDPRLAIEHFFLHLLV